MICETGEVETDAAKTYELLRKEINALNTVPGNKGIGVFYWEPEANSQYLPDGYTLGATEEVSSNTLRFTDALNAFKTGTTFLS
ncbi:glycosyl hydrolase 53 family protein, partial [Thomasclavelia ramosa]